MNIDFPFFLMCCCIVTGVIAGIDVLFIGPKRDAAQLASGFTEAQSDLEKRMPFIARESRSLFPVFLVVLVLRSFIIQPYKVPTGSLEPTIMPGDFIAVTMYNYGLRLPVWHQNIVNIAQPDVGDIVLFRWPVNPKINFVKRVVGKPGDHINYVNKVFYVNGVEEKQRFIGYATDGNSNSNNWNVKVVEEELNGVKHQIYLRPDVPAKNFYDLVVPANHYFMIGDNRDDSDDSRYWGFITNDDIIGKGRMVIFNWDTRNHKMNWRRIGKQLMPKVT